MQYLVGLDEKSKTIPLGRWGEKSVTEIAIDVSSWIAEYGTGTVTMFFKRSGDIDFYPATTNLSNGIATHTLSDADMQYLGKGEMGVIYSNSEGQIKKSRKYTTIVLDAVEGESTEPPAPYASWVTQILEAASAANEYASDAENARDAAIQAEEDTIQAKTDALAAIGKSKTDALSAIITQQTTSVKAVTDEGTTQVQKVKDEGASYQQQITKLDTKITNLASVTNTTLIINTIGDD